MEELDVGAIVALIISILNIIIGILQGWS